MHKRVFLMNPPSALYRRDDRCQSKVGDQTVRVVFPPIELAVLAAMARDLGAEVVLKDYPTTATSREVFVRDVGDFQPDLILLNATAHTLETDMESLAIARELVPHVLTIARSEAVAINAEKVLGRFPALDVIIHGEPEMTFSDLICGTALPEVLGISWRDQNGNAVKNPPRPLIPDMDALPLPARDLIDQSLYRSPENGRLITSIHAQRGCPSKCVFCPAGSIYGYAVRERSVENIMREVQECVRTYGIRDFLFNGDTFTLHKKWLTDLCDAICQSKLDIHWGCNSRVDTIDDERASAMKCAGCWVVAFGFEHGSQVMLDHMKKGTRVSRAREAVAICRRNGLRVHGFFVVGTPWETEDTLKQALSFARELDLDFFDFNIACPLPGTELYEITEREGLFETQRSSDGSYAQAGVRTYALSSQQLTDWRRKALLQLYARPRYVLRTLRYAASSGNTMHYVRAALNRLGSLLSR